MFDLDEILDEVRSKYYKSAIMRRPTISWSEDFCTGCLGSYNYYTNHITISRIFQNDNIPRDVVACTVHHENIHQDYADHGKAFQKLERLYPNSKMLDKQVQSIADKVHASLQYPKNYNDFLNGKKRVVYIYLANYSEDYISAFASVDCKFLVNAAVDLDFKPCKKDDFYVFLVAGADGALHIVGWCTDGKLLKTRQIEYKKKIGGDDALYQFETDYGKLYILPETCCDYGIPPEGLDESILNNNACVYDVSDPAIKEDIAYINSYCEGYVDIGFSKSQLETIPKIADGVQTDELKKIVTDDPFRQMWICNAIYQREPTDENLCKRALARIESGLYTAALADFLVLVEHDDQDPKFCTGAIKLLCISDRIKEAEALYKAKKTILPSGDEHLNNCVKMFVGK